MIRYTPEQLEFLKVQHKLPRKQLTELFNKKFATQQSIASIRQICFRKGWKASKRKGRFKKNHTPWNKGKKQGFTPEKCFKKGHISLNKRNTFSERLDKNGRILIKTPASKWEPKQRWVWEQHHGKLNPNQVVRFKDGNVFNCMIDNLFVVTRAEHLKLNYLEYDSAPGNLKPSIRILASLLSQISERTKNIHQKNRQEST